MVPGSVRDPISRSKLESDQERHWNMLSLTLHKHDIQITHWYRHVHKPKWICTDPPITHARGNELRSLWFACHIPHMFTYGQLGSYFDRHRQYRRRVWLEAASDWKHCPSSFPNSFLALFPHCPEVNGFLRASAHGNRTNVPWIKTFGTISPK